MSMIEKVARAICTASQIDPDRKGNETEWRWQEFLPEAQAAIEAMREPTETMLNAGYSAEHTGAAILPPWEAMIDAALSEASS